MMLAQAVISGAARPGGTVRLNVIDRDEDGERRGTIEVSVDDAREHLVRAGILRKTE